MVYLLASSEKFDKLQSLQPSHSCCCCGQGWHNATCLQLYCDPVHWVKLVVSGSAVAHCINGINVEVLVIILLKLFWVDNSLAFLCWLQLFQEMFESLH